MDTLDASAHMRAHGHNKNSCCSWPENADTLSTDKRMIDGVARSFFHQKTTKNSIEIGVTMAPCVCYCASPGLLDAL